MNLHLVKKEENGGQTPPKKQSFFVRLVALCVTAALLLGALVLVVYRDRYNLDALKRWLAYRALETGETGEAESFPYAGGGLQSVAYLDDGFLFACDAGAHYYSFSGKQYAEEVAAMTNPVLSACAKAGAVYDAGGGTLHLFRQREKALTLTLPGEGSLLSVRPNDAGWLAVTAQESGYKGAVTVYNSSGEKELGISLSSTFLVDAALSPDCKTVAVVSMGQSGGAFRSELLLYPINATEPSARYDLGNTTVLDLEFEKDAIWVLGEKSLAVLSADAASGASYSFGRSYLKGCSLGGDGFALLLLGRYRSGQADRALVVGPDAAAQAEQELSAQTLAFDAAGRYLCLLCGDALNIYTPDLTPYATLENTHSARYAALSPNGSALLADDERSWLFLPD